MIQFANKAKTLELLKTKLQSARVLPQIRFSVKNWKKEQSELLSELASQVWFDEKKKLVVRSSAAAEDSCEQSLAGHFTSLLDIKGLEASKLAVEKVIDSLKDDDDEIFIQPMLENSIASGVAFTKDPNTGSPYIVINYDAKTQSTSSVTAGNGKNLDTFYYFKASKDKPKNYLAKVVALCFELEELFQSDQLDIEFALDQSETLYLFQVRPLIIKKKRKVSLAFQSKTLRNIKKKIDLLTQVHPYLHGAKAIYGVMPDWNPAEIIGKCPKPLSLSLYRDLVTDSTWAYQRDNYGYRNLRSFPLLVSFHGLPYIDVRVSFNSFLPKTLNHDLAERLVNYYLARLEENPDLHDKVEFDILFSCYTFDLKERLQKLHAFGFDQGDCHHIEGALVQLSNEIIDDNRGLWRKDLSRIKKLQRKQEILQASHIDDITRLYWLVEDCKRYGTLPFAGLARAGFIAVQILNSLVSSSVFSLEDKQRFMHSLETVSTNMSEDFKLLSKKQFLRNYGHLRPGSYEITTPRYDEAPELYFDWNKKTKEKTKPTPSFKLSKKQSLMIDAMLKKSLLHHDATSLFNFIRKAIVGREYAKFIFTKSLSDSLALVAKLGKRHGLSANDCSYLNIFQLKQLYSESCDVSERLHEIVIQGKKDYALSQTIILPPLISKSSQVFSFHLPPSNPNFITQKSITAQVCLEGVPREELKGKIVAIPSADPGYDWIFSCGIVGFFTQYGGVNSHMAIRAGELSIPAIIGAGEKLFSRWKNSKSLLINCANKQVHPIS